MDLLFVFLGGGIGSVMRYAVSLLWQHLRLHPRFADVLLPWPTLVANVVGCALIGLFYAHSQRWGLSPEVRLMLTTGLCGGFTTFSTFSYEGLALLQQGHVGLYVLYLTLTLLLGLAAVWLAMR